MNNKRGITRENLLSIFPRSLAGDQSLSALASVGAQILDLRGKETDIPRIFPEIDRLDEEVLDILAYDLKVDWYDYDYPVQAKRDLIKNSVIAHKRMGTVYAVKLVLNSLYPKSELEEWFDYDGTPGCFRLNVNISNSAAEGAVEVYSTEEILRRIATVKRLSAHLEGVSYMVRNAIVVRHRIDSWQYRVPECNTLRCGTWWTRKTLGWSERHRLAAGGSAEAFRICPELSGTLPDTATPGYSIRAAVRISGRMGAYQVNPKESGLIQSGTEWQRRTLGWSERPGPLAVTGRTDAYGITPEFSGTLPEPSRLGFTLACGTVRAGGVIDAFTDNPKEAGAPEITGTWPETARLGHSIHSGAVQVDGGAEVFNAAPELAGTLPGQSKLGYTFVHGVVRTGGMTDAFTDTPKEAGTPEITGKWPETATEGQSITAGAVRATGSVETFKATPELAGTLPEEITMGYAITGELSTGARTEGTKVEPEYTGTLPKEAQHGEREE